MSLFRLIPLSLALSAALTTGATVNECARVLLRAGAKEVNVLTLARAVRVAAV